MTNNPELNADGENSPVLKTLWKATQVILATVLAIFSLGVAVGGTVAALDNSANPGKVVAILAVSLSLVAASGWWLWKLWASRKDEPVSPRTRRARQYMALSMVLGVVIGLGFSLAEVPAGQSIDLFSNTPLPAVPTMIMTALYVVGLPLVGWMWHRSIDEHEAAANSDGALVGMYTYSIIAPAWWVGERAGYLPAQQPMIVFLIVLTVWGLVWGIRRLG